MKGLRQRIYFGIIIGYEVAIRTLRAIQPNHKNAAIMRRVPVEPLELQWVLQRR